jgi:pSer/pThr/pTyr-binding forkhead associated (FHA) protein
MKKVTFFVLEGVDRGRVFRQLPIPVTIGREEGNSLRLNDERISRFHAKVQNEDGDVILTDLESTNGTRVNGVPIQIRCLRPGDLVSIGRSTLRFGTPEEIEERLKRENPSAHAAQIPQGKTVSGTLAGEAMDFDLNVTASANQFIPPTRRWGQNGELNYPPLPQKLSAAQAAYLSELFDHLQTRVNRVLDRYDHAEDLSTFTVRLREWQEIVEVSLLLARYSKAVTDPEQAFE